VQHLDFSSTPLLVGGGFALSCLLCTNKSCTSLNIAGCHIGSNAASKLARALRSNGILKELNLSNNELGTSAISDLADQALTTNTITDLDISCNAIQDVGARIMAQVLVRNTALTKVRRTAFSHRPHVRSSLHHTLHIPSST
jgi:Ran GTPase-activating protein (RanGAP) involved in mRNA processing and transport